VILRGWGVMNPVALKARRRSVSGRPHHRQHLEQFEEDVRPAGDAAKGFVSITTHPSGTDYRSCRRSTST
jgi:branched-chain amino acid transport system substrate-binding protein